MSAAQFVGRRSLLSDIKQHFYHVMSGQPRVLLLQGLAGVGKSRLLQEIQAMAVQQGFQVSTGSCQETLTEPYAPFASLLPRFESERVLEDSEIEMLRHLSSPSIPYLQDVASEDTESDKLRFMMTVARATTIFSLCTPMLLVLDDLHWADQSLLDLFDYLAFALTEERLAPLLLLGSSRPVASETRLGRLLSRLQREVIAREIEVPGLDEAETRILLRELGIRRPTQQLVRAVWEATQGIPLFIEEAVHHLLRSGALYTRGGYLAVRRRNLETLELPPSLSDAIAVRMQSLPGFCLPVLTLAACLGETFSIDRLQVMGQTDAAVIQEVVEAGVEHGFLVREDDHIRFAHTLIRHAFTARLSIAQRQRLHLQIAEALERLYAGNLEQHVLEIAYHMVEAGDLVPAQTVLDYARQAGDQAYAMFAWEDAVCYYEAAIQAVADIEDFVEQEKAALYLQAGMAYWWSQDVGPALDHFERATAAFRMLGDQPGLGRALMWQTQLHFTHASVPFGVLPPHVPELHDILGTLGDTEPRLRGHIMEVLSQAYRHARQAEQAHELAERAFDIGRQEYDDRLCARASEALGLAYLGRLHVQPAIDRWQETLIFAERAQHVIRHSSTLVNLSLAFNLQGALDRSSPGRIGGGLSRSTG